MKLHMKRKDEWKLIRFIPKSMEGWVSSDDVINMKELEYGNPRNSDKAWARKFDHMKVLKYKVVSVGADEDRRDAEAYF